MINQRLKEYLDLQAHKQEYYSVKFGMTSDKLSKILGGSQGIKSDDLEIISKELELTPNDLYYIVTGTKIDSDKKKSVKCTTDCDTIIYELRRDKDRLLTILEKFFTQR